MPIVAGIICEYNPFHSGHLLQIQKLRQLYGADIVVCAMGGHFLQRGEPSLVAKDRRARMALACGADLVFELPALYATRSAYWFALGGVSVLAAAGVTHLAFGAETDGLPDLQATAERLVHPDSAYTDGLRRALAAGLSYAEAQAQALNAGGHQDFVPVLPNDRLALSYLRVIAEKQLDIAPILIHREGGAFLDEALPSNATLPGNATMPNSALLGSASAPASPASATAIRHKLLAAVRQTSQRRFSADELVHMGLAPYIPEAALPWLADAPLVFPEDAEALQLALFRRATLDSLQALPDMTEGLEYRVLRAAGRAEDMETFYRLLKTKRYTMTRLRRLAAHLLLDYREAHGASIREGAPYLRLLGANTKGQQHLHTIRKTATLPVITRYSQMKALAKANPHAAAAWQLELRSTAMRCLLSGESFAKGNPEYFLSSISIN